MVLGTGGGRVTTPSKRKGDTAELDAARIVSDLTGWRVRRKLGAGRTDDEGDLEGLPDCVAEVKSYADIRVAIAQALTDCEREQKNANTTFGMSFIKWPRSRTYPWFVVLTLEQAMTLLREATT